MLPGFIKYPDRGLVRIEAATTTRCLSQTLLARATGQEASISLVCVLSRISKRRPGSPASQSWASTSCNNGSPVISRAPRFRPTSSTKRSPTPSKRRSSLKSGVTTCATSVGPRVLPSRSSIDSLGLKTQLNSSASETRNSGWPFGRLAVKRRDDSRVRTPQARPTDAAPPEQGRSLSCPAERRQHRQSDEQDEDGVGDPRPVCPAERHRAVEDDVPLDVWWPRRHPGIGDRNVGVRGRAIAIFQTKRRSGRARTKGP